MSQNNDVSFQDLEDKTRVTFISEKAKEVINNEVAVAGYIETKDGITFLDIQKDNTNKNNMIAYIISHNLSTVVLFNENI